MKQWKAIGYRIDLHFLWLPSVDLAIERAAARVSAGGHDIPESTIRRRSVPIWRDGRVVWLGLGGVLFETNPDGQSSS